MARCDNRPFIAENNMKLESFRPLGIRKIIVDHKWDSTVTNIEEYVPRIMQEFYANLYENVDNKENVKYRKVYVRGHIYKFSLKDICDFLKIHLYDFDDFDKEYDMDKVASELLGVESVWLEANLLKVPEMTLKYPSLHKIALTN